MAYFYHLSVDIFSKRKQLYVYYLLGGRLQE